MLGRFAACAHCEIIAAMLPPRAKIVHARQGQRFEVQGLRITYKACSHDTEGEYVLSELTVPAQHRSRLQIHHREDVAFYVLKGVFALQCGDELLTAGPGAFVLLPKGVRHAFSNVSESDGKLLCLHSPAGIEEFVEHMSVFGKERNPLHQDHINALAARCGIEFLDEPPS